MTATTSAQLAGPGEAETALERRDATPPPHHPGSPWKLAALLFGAGVFLFPFYYMIIGSLQKKKNPQLSGLVPNPSNLTLHNYVQINSAISLGRTLVNSGIFTGGVLVCTLIFGVLAGYALARLHFRGRGTLFAAMLLLQVIPFQLIIVPLYVLIVRNYGLADNYLGIIAPFAINSTAVFVFRQYFLQLPAELFEAARIDGASEMRILRSIAIPMVKPALMTAALMTFIGPWNEFLWPFLITKKHDMQPLAVALSNYITTVSATAANPFGAILAGACVLAAPAIVLFLAFQSKFVSTDIGSGVKGVTVAAAVVSTSVPYTLRRIATIMSPDPDQPFEVEGVLNPASGRDPEGRLWLLPRVVAAGNVSRVGRAEVVVADGVPVGVRRDGIALAPDAGWEHALGHGGVEDPRTTWLGSLGLHVMTYVAFGPLGPRLALATSPDLRTWSRLGPIHFGFDPALDTDLNLFANKDAVFFPEPVVGPDGRPAFAMLHRPMWDLSWIRPGEGTYLPAGLEDPRPAIWISYAPVDDVTADYRRLGELGQHRLVALPEYDFEAVKIGAGPPPLRVPQGWLLIHHGVAGKLVPGWGQQQDVRYCAGAMLLDADDPSRVVARTAVPILEPEWSDERLGPVPNVVFPTAIERIGERTFVFYGMADARIGVAELESTEVTG